MAWKYVARGIENGTHLRLSSYGMTEEEARRGLRSAAGFKDIIVYKVGEKE